MGPSESAVASRRSEALAMAAGSAIDNSLLLSLTLHRFTLDLPNTLLGSLFGSEAISRSPVIFLGVGVCNTSPKALPLQIGDVFKLSLTSLLDDQELCVFRGELKILEVLDLFKSRDGTA